MKFERSAGRVWCALVLAAVAVTTVSACSRKPSGGAKGGGAAASQGDARTVRELPSRPTRDGRILKSTVFHVAS